MNRVSSFVYRGAILTASLALVFTAGCGKKPLKAPEPAKAPETPPPPKPTVSIQASPTSINKGGSTTLSWTSTDATQLTIAPDVGAVNAQGSTTVSPADSTTYTVTASGPGGSADSSVRVTVTAPPPPPPVQEQAPDYGRMFLENVKDAYFDFNKADIRTDARQALGQTADFLRKYPQIKMTIEGHCDERGAVEYNIALGDRRASAVKNYLVQLGIAADRMTTVSYGKEKPFCTESNEECWQRNRVGHFVYVP
jgi:peptidoglycan-associated lipoprotein